MKQPMIPGEVRTIEGTHLLNAGRETRVLVVTNDGDRPVQIGSHFHFADVNPVLAFDRASAAGFRLDVAAGTAVRFEPGASREVTLVRFRGAGVVPGLQVRTVGGTNGRTGALDDDGVGA